MSLTELHIDGLVSALKLNSEIPIQAVELNLVKLLHRNELSTLRTQNQQQAERIRQLEGSKTMVAVKDMIEHQAVQENDKLHKENQQLRAALASAREKLHFALAIIGHPENAGTVALKNEVKRIDAILSGQQQEDKSPACNNHPDAPHGFDRTASYSRGRYVCKCEGWKPEDPRDKVIEAVERFINSPISVETCTNMLAAIEQFRKEKV